MRTELIVVIVIAGSAAAWAIVKLNQLKRWMIERDGKYNSDGTPKDQP